jgi:hypothetical protein
MIVGLMNLCLPAQVYIGLTILLFIIVKFIKTYNPYYNDKRVVSHDTWLEIFVKIIVTVFLAWILNIVCHMGFTFVAWGLAVLLVIHSIYMHQNILTNHSM